MIEQTTLHNILTWVIAVVLFIFQSLNYFIAWIKKYVKHGQKTTTVVTTDTTISSESILDNKNVPENVITVQGLIQKHFDIPLIIAENEPKVYNFIKSAQLLTSNEICKEKTKIDQFMENLVDDSYVARGLGLITATVGRQSEFYLYSKYDNNFENVIIRLNGRNGEIGQITILSKNPTNIVEPKSIPMDYIYDKDRIKVTYTPFAEGVYTLTLVRNSLSICRSPYYISVEKSPTNSRSQIRLGTKKYKPVTRFTKSRHSLETYDNSIPVIEPSKPSICKNILPESEKNSIRTDVMSIVTKFESNSINFQKKVHKSTSSVSEKGSETDMNNEITKYSNIPPKIETDNVHDTYVSDLNSPSIHSKIKSTDKNFWNDVDITYKNSKASDINTIDFESEQIMKPMTKLNKHVGITKDILEVKNVSSTPLQPTNSVLVESLKIENLHDVEKHNQTFKTTELMDENKLIEKRLDPTTRIYESEIKCIDDEPCIINEVSCFDDEDRKTVVVMDNNEIESNPNDTVIQQITDSAQYNINTPFASVITKITNSICEKCSIQVLKIISEFPRDINITHKNNSNEIRSSFETLLAQPISININIDNMFEQPISATNEHDSEHLLTINPTNIKQIGTIDKDIQCSYLNEIEQIDNNSDELCGNINNMSKELMIKQNKHNSKIDEIFDHCIVPFTESTLDKHNTKNNELSTNEIMKIKYSTTNEDNVFHSNQFNNNTIHKSDNKMEIQRQHLQKSSEHSIGLIKTNQFHENINKELNHISKESDKPLGTSDLVTINYDENTNCELITDEFKINNVIIPDENTNIQSSVINNIVLASKEVTLVTTEDIKEQKNNISYKNVALTSIQNENQKLMIEKSIEPVLANFKNKMVEKITQLYLNRDSSNTDNTSTFETHEKHLINNLHEIQINNNANSTEINTKCIETLTSQLKNYIDKNDKSEIVLDQQKTDSNHLLKCVENIIKTKINPSGLYAHTLGEIKLQTLVNTAMNHPNNQQIDNEFKNMIIDNDTQDDKLKKINNDEIVQDIETMLIETPSITIIKNTDELILPKNEVTVTTQCKIPLINDFDTIEREYTNTDSKQEMQTINVNENDTIVETNAVEIKALQNFQKSHNTKIITPIIELRLTLETRIMNTSELVTVEENSSKEMQTTIEIIDSINIPEETDAVENIDDKNEFKSVKLQFKENVIKIPHLVEKETLNEVAENTSTNTSTKSNLTESVSMQAEIESPGLTKVCSANDVTIERDTIYKLPPPAENIVIDKPISQSIPTLGAQVSINVAKVTIGINTSDPQFSNTTITVLIPSKIPLIEDNSFIPKLKIVNTLNKLDTVEILTIPKYSATCDTKITKMELQNTSEPTSSPKKLYMKNRKLEKIENIDESPIPIDTEIETLEYLNKSGKIKSIPPISNDTLAETTAESKTEKNTLHKTLNPKYKMTNLEPTVNYVNCNNNKNETTISNSSSTGEVVEKSIIESTSPIYPQREPDEKVYEMLICTETETPTVIDTSTASLVHKIVVEIITNKNKTPIEALEIIVHEPIEEDIVIVRETTPTMNSLVAVMDEQVNIKNDGSDTYYVRSDDIVTNTGTKTQKSIGQNNAEKNIEIQSPVQINTLTGVVMEIPKMNIVTVTAITSNTNSSTETINVKTNVEKVIEEESPSSMNTSSQLVQENTNIDINTENETLLPIESTVEPKIEFITEPEIISCTDSSTLTVDVQTDVEKDIEEESLSPMNSSGELVKENTNIDINTEDKTLLPIESTVEPKIEDITEPEITSCTESATEIIDFQFHTEKIVDEVLIDSLGEVMGENTNINITLESEKLLPIVSTEESILEPTVEDDISVAAITSYTNSSTETLNVKTNVEKVIEEESPSPMNSSGELVQENTNIDINTENETLLPIESTVEPKIEDITVTTKTSCADSSTLTVDVQTDVEKDIEEESPSPMNSSGEQVQENTNIDINTENKTLLPIESTVDPKIEDITEPEITSCTESATEIIDIQFHTEKIVDEVLIDSLGEVMGENTNINIALESEKLLPIVSTEESILEPTVEDDITVTTKTSCADSSTLTVDVQTDVEKDIEEESPSPMSSSGEQVQENTNIDINTENKTLLPTESKVEPKIEDITKPEITSCTESATEIIDIQFHTEKIVDEVLIDSLGEIMGENTNINIVLKSKKPLPIVSTEESILEPTVEDDISVAAITSYTNSSTETLNVKTNVEKVIEEESPSPMNSSGELVQKNTNIDINTENETLLPIESTVEPKIEFITEPEIISCTDSSTLTVDVQTDVEKDIEEESPSPMNSSGEQVQENTNIDINTENKTLLPTESKVEPKIEDITKPEITSCTESATEIIDFQFHTEKIVDEVLIDSLGEVMGENTNINIALESEKLLPIVSTEESILEPTVEDDISVAAITSYTNSATETLNVKTNVEKVIEEESPSPMNSSGELVQENTNIDINTENETLLPIESTVEPKIEDITEPEITSCTESATEIIDIQFHTEKIVDEVLIDSLGEVMGEKTNINIVLENEKLLPIVSTEESILEPTVENDITVTTKTSCADSSTLTVDVQTDVEKDIEEESPSPMNSSGEQVQENTNIDINTENKTLLPIESTVDPKIEDITEPEITSCTESATEIIDIQFHTEKIVDEVLMDSLGEVMGENTNINIALESEKLLPIVSTEESILEPTVEDDITVTTKTSCADSSTLTVDVQTDVEKDIEEESPSPMSSSGEQVQENTNIDINTENKTLLPTESKVEPKIEDITKPEITSCTESATEIIDIQFHTEKIVDEVLIDSLGEIMGENTNINIVLKSKKPLPIVSTEESILEPTVEDDISVAAITSYTNSSTETLNVKTNVEKVIEEESPSPMNSSGELVQKNTNIDINTENETLLPIESTVEPKIEFITEPEIISCTDSSTLTVDVQTDVEKDIEEESPSPMNSSGEQVQENTNIDINTENKTLLPTESKVEPKIEDITKPEITSCTESATEIIDFQFHTEKIVDEVLIDSLGEVMGENTNINIALESEKLLPIVSTEESILEPTVEDDISVAAITSYTNSATETLNVKTNVEKVIEEESPSPMNSSGELVQENTNIDINTENETLLPIESTVEPKIEDITEPEITSCTESATEIIDIQFHTEKIVDEVLIDSLGEVMGEKTNINIVLENEKLLPIVSTEESILEPTVENDITVTTKTSCADSSTLTVDVQTDVEKDIEEESPSPMNSSGEQVQENTNIDINTENKTLLPIESTVDPKIEDITEPEITSCTESATEIIDIQFHTEKIVDEVLMDSLGEVMGENTNINIALESEKLLPIVSTEESILEPTVEDDITVTTKTSCTDSSTLTVDVQTDVEKDIEEESPSPMNSSGEQVQENTNIDINTENKTLLPIESTVEPKIEDITEPEITSCTESATEIIDIQFHTEKIVDEVLIDSLGEVMGENTNINIALESEKLLPIVSTEESILEPTVEDDITVTTKTSCADSSTLTVDVQTDVEKDIEEESPSPMSSSGEQVQENTNIDINTENKTLLPTESKVEPKIEDITKPEITSCTESATEIIDIQFHTEKIVDEVLIDSLGEIMGENTNINIVLKSKKPLPIVSTEESILEPKVEDDISVAAITSYTNSSTETLNVKTNVEKVIEEESPSPMNSSGELVQKNTNIDINTENETLLPIESTVEPKIEFITEPEIISCTDSSTLTVDVQTDVEKDIEEESPSPMNSSGEQVQENTNIDINTENKTLLPTESKVEPKIEDITKPEITSCTESATEIIDFQFHTEKIVDEVLIDSLGEVMGENTNINIALESEKLLPIVSTEESILEPTVEDDISVAAITSYTNSATETLNVKTNVEKVIEEESPSPMNSSGELVQENTNIDINTENETLLPIESTVEPKIEDITEPEITSCTESATEIIDFQFHTEKIVDEVLIDSLGEVMGENTNINIALESEKLLPIVSTEESILEPTVEDDITVTTKTSCTDSSTLTVDVQTDVEKDIEEESPSPMNSSGEQVQENTNIDINTENKTLLPIESTVEPKIEDITEPEITSCTESATEIIDIQFHTEKIVDEVLIDSLGEVMGENTNINIVLESEKLLPIVSTEESILEPTVEDDISVAAITSYTNSSTETVNVKIDEGKLIEEESPSPMNSSGELVQENTNIDINTENKTLLPIESTVEPKIEDITEPEITSCTESATEIIDIQFHSEKIVDEVLIDSLGEVMGENTNINIVLESEKPLSIVSTEESILEPTVEDDISVTVITSYTNSSTETINFKTNVEKVIEEESPSPLNSPGELVQENTNIDINTENKTLLPIESTVEPKIEFITEPEIISCTDFSTFKVIEEESLSQMKSLDKVVQGNTNVSINTKNETLLQIDTTTSSVEEMKEIDELIETSLSIKSNMESIKVSKKVEDINETEKISFTESSILTKDIQTDIDIAIEKKCLTQINFLGNIPEENTKVNNDTKNETILPIESTEELTVEPIVETGITETAITSFTDSSIVTVDVQTNVEKVIEDESSAPIHSLGEVVGESTKFYMDTVNETLLQIDTSITAVKSVLEEKIIENEYSTQTFSPFLDVEKQIDVIIDSKTETLFPIGTNTTFVDEPKVLGHVSENEHAALIDSSITNIKQQIKVDTETEIETLLLIDNLTESIKEQIVEKITENKTPTLIDSLAEMIEEGSKVNIETDNQTLLTINTSSINLDDQIEKNETKTPIYCVVNVAEEQTKVNIETNNKTITPIDIFTTSIEEQLNVEYLCENENTIHIDYVPTMIKNQTKIDIKTENETLLSIENTSFKEQMDEVDKIIQNNLLVDFSAATKLKGFEILTDTETETSTSIDTLNTTVDRQIVKENFKEIESRIRVATSTAFEEEQKSVEHITVKENVLSIDTSSASVKEEIQVEEVIENESASLISYSTIQDVASLEEPKVIKNDTTAMNSSVTVVEEQTEVAAAEVVIDTCEEPLDKTMIDKGTRHNETPKPIDILVIASEKQTVLEKVAENEIPMLVNTSTKSVEKQIKTEKGTENETITLIACEALPKIETNEFEAESENETSTPVNNSASIRIKQTEAEDVIETTLRNDDIIYRNTKTNFIGTENKTENSDNPNNCYLKFGESSKMHSLENEDNLQRKSYGIQKLEMSVQRMKTSDEDYYEKTFVQLEQTEKISKVDKINVDDENKTIIDDKLYTVNESDLNAILCASSLEEALTLLDSKIKFKFKHKKSSSKINSVEYIPKIQTSDSNSSGVNTNFTDARKFFKEIEKKSKK